MTVILELDDDVVAKAEELLARRDSNLRQAVEDSLRNLTVADIDETAARKKESFADFLTRFARFETGGPYTHDEMNER